MLALMFVSSLAAVTGEDVQMTLTMAKPKVLVGEYSKARVRWTAKKPVEVLFGAERVLIDDGTGYRPHAEADFAEALEVALPTKMDVGDVEVTEYTIGLKEIDVPASLSGLEAATASLRFVFSRPGQYRVKVRYEEVESNEAIVDVVAPAGQEADIFQTIQRQPLVLTWMGRAEATIADDAEGLIAQYGAHPYLARTILAQVGGYDQSSFDRLRSLDLTQSAFEDERLLRIAERSVEYLGAEWQRQALRDLIEKFPDSVSARKAQELLLRQEDTEPPTLAVEPMPAVLWPPNHRLEPITMSIQVADDRDPNPRVKLTSITCNDACNPAQDISGAAFGTDDRQFSLRSERRGAGQGRTYTIVYLAEDANGNTRTAEATVTVAHDQGQGQSPGNRGAWSSGVSYRVNDLVTHDGFTWKCIRAHSSQWDWAPPRVPALWIKIPKGKEWDHPVQYAFGAEVTFQGATYACLQAHTSQVGWDPSKAPALWTRK